MPRICRWVLVCCLALGWALPGGVGAEEEKDPPPNDPPAGEEPPKKADEPEDPPPGEEPEAPKPKGKQKGIQIAPSLWPPLPEGVQAGPAGTVYLEGGPVQIGTKPAVLSKLIASRPPDQRSLFLHEKPQYEHLLEPVYLQRYELSNAQYRRFLDDFVRTYDTGSGGLGTIERIVAKLWSVEDKERRNVKYKLWRQFYEANKDVIWEALRKAGKLEKHVVRRPGGEVDEDATAKKMRHVPLPRGLKLTYLSPMRPPRGWKDFNPDPDELDHPVRYCSYNDFERFGVWAGMHVQTEGEYEFAARGSKASMYPWGDTFPQTAKLNEMIVNWGAKITNKRFEPTTVPCHALPGGASWCGVFNLVGNVGEWTASWFENYKGNSTRNQFLGRFVKVIRGGSGVDLETLVLRPAFRNWQGNDAKGPPYPDNAYPWIGARMASYIESGRDQLGPITRHVVRYKKVKEHHLNLRKFKGMVSNNWTEPGAEVTNHVYVLGRSASVVFIPVRTLLVPDRNLALRELWEKSSRVRKTSSLLKRSESEEAMFVLGVLHIDAPLAKVQIPEPPPDPDAKDEKGKKKKKPKRRRRKKGGPPTVEGSCPQGTYLLTFWHGKLCLTKPSLSFACFLPTYPGQKWQAQVVKTRDKEAPIPETTLAIDTDLDEGPLKFQILLGGEKPDEAYRVEVDALLTFETGALEGAGNGTWHARPRPKPKAPTNGADPGGDEGEEDGK